MQTIISGNGDWKKTLVVVFLRGGADGINMVAPVGDDSFHSLRPNSEAAKGNGVALDGFFSLHPQLRPLLRAFKDGDLAVIHGTGSEDDTRSHFEAQDLMEHGGLVAGGWLGRFLRNLPHEALGPLAAVALGKSMPESLRGAPSTSVFEKLSDFSLPDRHLRFRRALEKLYTSEQGSLFSSAKDTFDAISRIESLNKDHYTPANDARYGRYPFAQGMLQLAQLIKADVGALGATIDLQGWDSHLNQENLMVPRMKQLGETLEAFHQDLGKRMKDVTVVVMTEFGRRVSENTAFGTDHGRASAMFVMGQSIRGGKVISDWKGLKEDQLEGPGDLPVTINYRNVLSPILNLHGLENVQDVFPDFPLAPVALV